MADKYDVAVIGAGPGGYAAAFRAADLGLKTVLIESDKRPGGVCLLRGCIPSKALLHAAQIITQAKEADTWGLSFAPPRIDLDVLRKKKEEIVNKLSGGVGVLAKTRGVTLIQGRAAFTSSNTLHVMLADAQAPQGGSMEIQFGKAILATGSRPIVPRALHVDDPRWMDSTGALDLPFLPKRLLVVGGGYIGMELGTVYHALGSQITVVEGTDRLLGGADPDLVRPLQQRAQKMFHEIRLQSMVKGIEAKPDALHVGIETAGKTETLPFDAVLVAVGRRPNHEDLGLEKTGVKVGENGFVEVDKRLRTADASIYAIGDVAGEPMLAHKATREGLIAAEAIAGKTTAFDQRAIPAVVFTDPEIAWCGLTEAEAKEAGREVVVTKFPWAASGRATTLGRNDGLTKFIMDKKSGRILGVGIAGYNAGELIAEGVLAVEMGAVAEDVAGSIHAHPTLSETLMEGAELFLGRATHYTGRR